MSVNAARHAVENDRTQFDMHMRKPSIVNEFKRKDAKQSICAARTQNTQIVVIII